MILMGPFQLNTFPDSGSFQLHSSKHVPRPADPPCLSLWFSYTKQRVRKVGDKSLNDYSTRGAVASHFSCLSHFF